MSVKTILVVLTNVEAAKTLLKLAIPLARKHAAHLVGLHTQETLLVYSEVAIHVPSSTYTAFNKSQRELSDKIENVFQTLTSPEDFQSEWRNLKAEATSGADKIIECARAADLVIMSREEINVGWTAQNYAQGRVIRESGRPVIVVPHDYDGPCPGSTLLLGWADTREAARAAHDLIEIADQDARVTVLRVGSLDADALRDIGFMDLPGMLSRHGLKVESTQVEKGGHRIAEVLNEQAFEMGADLIAVGAFGHSRIYDIVIGAATHDLLQDAKYPVMFSK
ncbi:MAG: universal stress protein [Yoonia sp.]|nr:universal stress protein [Yoonia sp.]